MSIENCLIINQLSRNFEHLPVETSVCAGGGGN